MLWEILGKIGQTKVVVKVTESVAVTEIANIAVPEQTRIFGYRLDDKFYLFMHISFLNFFANTNWRDDWRYI